MEEGNLTWTALWKIPPIPMPSRIILLMFIITEFACTFMLFVTSYTCKITSPIPNSPPPPPFPSPPLTTSYYTPHSKPTVTPKSHTSHYYITATSASISGAVAHIFSNSPLVIPSRKISTNPSPIVLISVVLRKQPNKNKGARARTHTHTHTLCLCVSLSACSV